MKYYIKKWIEEEEKLNRSDITEKERITIYAGRERRERKKDIYSYLKVFVPVIATIVGFLYAFNIL